MDSARPLRARHSAIFGLALINQIVSNYSLRVAGVYMMSIASLWSRTGVVPRWLTITTCILALIFLFSADTVCEARMLFPGWVFIASIYILIRNYREKHGRTEDPADS